MSDADSTDSNEDGGDVLSIDRTIPDSDDFTQWCHCDDGVEEETGERLWSDADGQPHQSVRPLFTGRDKKNSAPQKRKVLAFFKALAASNNEDGGDVEDLGDVGGCYCKWAIYFEV